MSHNNYKKVNGMRYPALNDLIKRANNKYELVLATAKRAREIIDGANPLIPVRINNPISIATEEIDEGLIELVNPAFGEHPHSEQTKEETAQDETSEGQDLETAPSEADVEIKLFDEAPEEEESQKDEAPETEESEKEDLSEDS